MQLKAHNAAPIPEGKASWICGTCGTEIFGGEGGMVADFGIVWHKACLERGVHPSHRATKGRMYQNRKAKPSPEPCPCCGRQPRGT